MRLHSIVNFLFTLYLVSPALVVAEVLISEVKVSGQKFFTEEEMLRNTGVRRRDNFTDKTCEAISSRVTRKYEQIGRFKSEINCLFQKRDPTARSGVLHIEIREGEPEIISTVILDVELPPEAKKRFTEKVGKFKGKVYSPRWARDWKKDLLFDLRTAGYLFATVNISYQEGILSVHADARDLVQLRFEGNRGVSDKDLLMALHLEERAAAITERTLEAFVERLRDFYEERGYFLARVGFEKLGTVDGLLSYRYNFLEGSKIYLREVNLGGNTVFSNSQILKSLRSKPKDLKDILSSKNESLVTRRKLAADLNTIEDLYRAKGYLAVSAEAIPSINGDALSLQIKIYEGQLFKVVSITNNSSECDEKEEIDKFLKTFYGKMATEKLVDDIRDELTSYLYSVGYPQPDLNVNYDKLKSDLVVNATCGQKVAIGNIEILGAEITQRSVIEKALGTIRRGSLWNSNSIRRATSRLLDTGVFSLASIEPSDGNFDSQNEDIRVRVKERETGIIESSLSYNTEDGIRLGGELTQRNFQGLGQTVSLNADLFINDGSTLFDAGKARSFWKIPQINDIERLDLLTEGYLQYDIQTTNEFSFSRYGIDSQLKHTEREYSFSYGLSLFQDDIFDVSPNIVLGERDEDRTFYSFLTTKFEYRGREDLTQVRHGFSGSAVGKVASEVTASDLNLLYVNGETKYIAALTSAIDWANAVRGTIIEPFSDTDFVPLSQRLFLGGNRTLRGFSRNRISPLSLTDGRVGGDRQYILNSELQWNVFENLQLGLFVDAGEVFLINDNESGSEKSSGFRVAPGVGVRYRTPVGPIGIDLGFPLNRREGEASPRIYFGFNGVL